MQVIYQDIPRTHFYEIGQRSHVAGDEDCEIVTVVVPQVVGHLRVDNQTISIILVLHHADHLRVLCLGNFLLAPLLLVEG